jgi:hypothetical protein
MKYRDLERKLNANNIGVFFLVGSRAYDGAHPAYKASCDDSDWDIVIRISDLPKVQKIWAEFEESEYNNGIKVKEGDATVNFIPLIDVEMKAWITATQTLRRWASEENFIRLALQDRNARIGLLESLRATYKTGLALGSIQQGE